MLSGRSVPMPQIPPWTLDDTTQLAKVITEPSRPELPCCCHEGRPKRPDTQGFCQNMLKIRSNKSRPSNRAKLDVVDLELIFVSSGLSSHIPQQLPHRSKSTPLGLVTKSRWPSGGHHKLPLTLVWKYAGVRCSYAPARWRSQRQVVRCNQKDLLDYVPKDPNTPAT